MLNTIEAQEQSLDPAEINVLITPTESFKKKKKKSDPELIIKFILTRMSGKWFRMKKEIFSYRSISRHVISIT